MTLSSAASTASFCPRKPPTLVPDFDDHEHCCTWSSSSEDELPYSLPPRKEYGGVRRTNVAYDRQRAAKMRAAASPQQAKTEEAQKENCIVS